jgi:ribosomal protein S18 acetylase RimI-like enzyme
MISSKVTQPRLAQPSDYTALLSFINGQNYLHRHLDWRDSLEWLGASPFLLTEDNHRITSVLACPPEPPEVAWVRLFGVSLHHSPDRAWKGLIGYALETLGEMNPRPALVSLSLRDWYTDLLKQNSFAFHQDIVVFIYDQTPPSELPLEDGLVMREMHQDDLAQVNRIDHLAFEPIWRLSAQDMKHAYRKSTHCTVMELNGEIVGYQMSSSSGFYAHLARLAVHPSVQRRRIGFRLVQNLLEHFLLLHNCWGVTLNTQHNNHASLALYQTIGFRETGERFPVFIYAE